MRQLVFLIIAILQRYENAQVMRPSNDANICSGKLRTQLIVSPCDDSLLRAVDVEGGNGRVVGGLFGEVGDFDDLVAGNAGSTARRLGIVGMFEGRLCVFDLPCTLYKSAWSSWAYTIGLMHTLKNSPSVELYGLHGLPLTYFCRPSVP